MDDSRCGNFIYGDADECGHCTHVSMVKLCGAIKRINP
jgi:hypothetical protein